MSTPRFYVERLAPPAVDLPEAEARHARQSRRLSVGDTVALFDGCGRLAIGRIATATGHNLRVTIDQVTETIRPRPELIIAFAVPKGPRQDTLIEKCTELGATALQPIETARSVAAASPHRIDKSQRTVIEAAKQSGQAWLPELRELRPLQQVLRDKTTHDLALLAVSAGNLVPDEESAERTSPAPSCLTGLLQPTLITDVLEGLRGVNRVLALIGPEGGWTQEEIVEALTAGARPISIGPSILRIETAAIAIATFFHALRGE